MNAVTTLPSGPADAPDVLRVAGLCVDYATPAGPSAAVRDVDLAIGPGEGVAIVGESGSGKSTLALTIGGFLSTTDARVSHERLELFGEPLDRTRVRPLPSYTEGVAMVFQDAMVSLDPVWTVGSQLADVLRARAKDRAGRRRAGIRADAERWLHRVGLRDTQRVLGARSYELSGGMRQRAMMAIALCGRPRLLIADEPTSALDAQLSRDVMKLLLETTHELGTALMLISHDINLSIEYSDRIVVMRHGEIVEDAPSDRIREHAMHPYTRGLLASIPTLADVDAEELPTLDRFLPAEPVPS